MYDLRDTDNGIARFPSEALSLDNRTQGCAIKLDKSARRMVDSMQWWQSELELRGIGAASPAALVILVCAASATNRCEVATKALSTPGVGYTQARFTLAQFRTIMDDFITTKTVKGISLVASFTINEQDATELWSKNYDAVMGMQQAQELITSVCLQYGTFTPSGYTGSRHITHPPSDIIVFDLRYDNESPVNAWSSSCGINVPTSAFPQSPFDPAATQSEDNDSLADIAQLTIWTALLREHNISLDSAHHALVVLMCDQQKRNGVANDLRCVQVVHTLHDNLGFDMGNGAFGIERSTVWFASFAANTVTGVGYALSVGNILTRASLETLCAAAVNLHKTAGVHPASDSTVPTTIPPGVNADAGSCNLINTSLKCKPNSKCQWIKAVETAFDPFDPTPLAGVCCARLPVLSQCDPRNDLCDVAQELYCDPDEYECRYLPSSWSTTLLPVAYTPASMKPPLGAIDTTTTATASIQRTLAPATPDPSRKLGSHSKVKLQKVIFYCIGGLVVGMVAGIAVRVWGHRIAGCVKRHAVGLGDHYQNRAYEPLAMRDMDQNLDARSDNSQE